MAAVHIIAFFALILYIAYREKETLVDVIPAAACILILFLYGLAFPNALWLSDYLAAAGCIAFGIFCISRKRKGEKEFFSFCRKELTCPGTIMALVLLILVPVLTGSKVVTWWDDYNFWATDVKSIFYLNGFAEKYQNVAAEFGDYPPGTQMLKWWFLHFYPGEFKEGLMFAGYYFMNLCFLVPLLKHLKKWNIPLMLLMIAALWLFPSCVEAFGYDGCCADLTMAVIYGAFLVSVLDTNHSRQFYYGRAALLLMVLILCKNTGFMWTAFGLIFFYGIRLLSPKKEPGRDRTGILTVTLLPVLTEGSWLLFCLVNRRVAKLTGTALHMATGSLGLPEIQKEMVKAYFTAFFKYPLHRYSTFAIDVSPLALYVLLLLFLLLLYPLGRLEKRQWIFITVFTAVSGLVFYAVNLLSHLTIFATETQYLEPFGMVSSIERYGAPFTIGSLYLLADIAMKETDRKKEKTCKLRIIRKLQVNGGMLLCLLFVFLTADYESAWRGLYGYRESIHENLEQRGQIVDEAAEKFLEAKDAAYFESGGRVLYLRDVSDVSWVRNTYISFEAAPVSVMYGNVDASVMSEADVEKMAEEAHAGYLYAEEIQEGEKLFSAFVEDDIFESGCFYRIEKENGVMKLVKAQLR